MLSSNNNIASSIQKRRQMHRRQNSLEVPILATSLPAHRRQHRRGLSLDQQTSRISTGTRQLTPLQEYEPSATNTTNIGQRTQQHLMQETQQHRPAQPGFQDLEPNYTQQSIQQQRMLEAYAMQEQNARQGIAPPEQAIQNIQNQIKSFYQTYPGYVNAPSQDHSPVMGMAAQTPIIVAPRPCTPPNAYLPTPPATNKSMRVIRHLDVAPMPGSYSSVPIVHIEQSECQDAPLFQDSFGSEYGGTSSYQSSLADPMSPTYSPAKRTTMRHMSMPTLFEDASTVGASPSMLSQDQMMLAASEGQYYIDSPMSPREMMLQSLELDATIEDTGISAEEVQSFISEQDGVDGKWTCLFPECGKKFGRKENIRSHVQTHLGDRQFKCNHCGKCFVRQHDLKRHAKIHSGDKPHRCPCGNGFARQDALTRHRQRGVCEGALPGYERREVKRGRPRKSRPDMSDRVERASRARQLDARRGSEATFTSSSSCGASVRSDPYTPPHVSDTYDSEAYAGLDAEGQLDAFIKAYQDTPPTSPLTAGTSPSKTENFGNGTSSFDFAAVSDQVSQAAASSHSSPHGTASHEYASPKAVSNHSSPLITNSRPTSSGLAQSESFGDSVFDWGAIEPQPSLCQDPFSPAGASSSDGEFDGCFDSAFGQSKAGADSAFMGADSMLDFGNSQDMFNAGIANNADLFAANLDMWLATA